MKKENIHIYKKSLFAFIIVEFISLFLTKIFNFSLNNVVKLLVINLVIFSLLNYLLKKYLDKVITINKAVIFSTKEQYISIFLGFVVLIGSYFISYKFYVLGFSGILFPSIALFFNKLKDSSIDVKKSNKLVDITFSAMLFGILIPLLLDIHYNMLFIPLIFHLIISSIYFTIVIIYFIQYNLQTKSNRK